MRDGKCVAAGGVVMQLLPGTSEENMDKAEQLMQSFVNPAEVVLKYGADGIMENFFKVLPATEKFTHTFRNTNATARAKKRKA